MYSTCPWWAKVFPVGTNVPLRGYRYFFSLLFFLYPRFYYVGIDAITFLTTFSKRFRVFSAARECINFSLVHILSISIAKETAERFEGRKSIKVFCTSEKKEKVKEKEERNHPSLLTIPSAFLLFYSHSAPSNPTTFFHPLERRNGTLTSNVL